VADQTTQQSLWALLVSKRLDNDRAAGNPHIKKRRI